MIFLFIKLKKTNIFKTQATNYVYSKKKKKDI